MSCSEWLSIAVENEDYVKCALCSVIRLNLKQHLKSHDLTAEEYQNAYGPTLCEKSRKIKAKLQNWNWVARAKENDSEKYEQWRNDLGEKISDGIMASPSAREARRQNLARLNRTPESRKRSSDIAKLTSARPEIQEQRAKNLQRWRDENREEFYEKCVKAMHRTYQTLPERRLFELILERFSAHNFKRNQQIRRVEKFKSVKSGTRQIDVYDREHKIVVEFDGIYHFRPIRGQELLETVTVKDKELNDALVSEGFVVIRISYDQFDYKQGGHFNEDCVQRVVECISKGESGLYLIGEAYA